MKKISRSVNRHQFQKENYIKSQKEKSKPVSQEYIEFFDQISESHLNKFDDPKSQVNNLEYELLTTNWILEKTRSSEVYAQNLYAAMCNNSFQKLDVLPILKDERWSCSWRYAGGIIADMREEGDYIDWYCSGITGKNLDMGGSYIRDEFVAEGIVTDEIKEDLKKLGWIVIQDLDSPI